jgi:hypothetical protein
MPSGRRPAGSVLLEIHDEWAVAGRRYLSQASMAKLEETGEDDRTSKEVGKAKTTDLLAS